MIFRHDNLSFRAVEKRDLERILELRNDFSTWVHLTDPRPLRPGLQDKWLDGVNTSTDRFYWIVEDDGRFIGLIRMDEYDPLNRSIRVGADVSSEVRRKGYGLRIYRGILSYCFQYLGIHRIWLLVLATNEPALALYEKVGFKEEGRMRNAIWRGGRWIDYIMMSILYPEIS